MTALRELMQKLLFLRMETQKN